ncbi:hypothetical protein D3C85_1330740 [compost metagenome]
MIVLVAIGVERRWPWAYQSHVAGHYIDQVGQFVEAGAPQETTDAGDPRVLVDFEVDRVLPVFVQMPQRLLELFSVGHHGAELVHTEHPAAIAGAFLHEHHRARAGEPDGQCQHQQDWRDQQQNHQCAEAGKHPVGTRQRPWPAIVTACHPAATLHMNGGVEAHSVFGIQALVTAQVLNGYTLFMSSH